MERSVARRVFFDDDGGGVDGDASHRTGATEQRRVAVFFFVIIGIVPGPARDAIGEDPVEGNRVDASVIVHVGRRSHTPGMNENEKTWWVPDSEEIDMITDR